MIQPVEMGKTMPMQTHGGVSTTTEVWEVLTACREGDLDRVRGMIAKSPALSTCQYNYTPPLYFAVREGHEELTRELVGSGGIDPDYQTYPFRDSLLTMAQDRGYEAIAQFISESVRNPGCVRRWRDVGEIDYGMDETERLFETAVHQNNVREVERLLELSPELARNKLSSYGEGVMMMPAGRKRRDVIELLLRYGAKVPDVSKWCREYYFKHHDIAAFFMDTGMNPNHMSWHHVTLMHDMAQAGDIAKATLLLDHGAEIDPIDEEYRSTPLGLAARWGQQKMVRFLLGRGADPNKSGARWAAPLVWASKKGHAHIESDLRSAGATD
jgi:hypothetical protein